VNEASLRRPAFYSRVGEFVARFGLVLITLLIIALFSLMLPGTYPTLLNFEAIAANQATTLLLALAILLPLIVGEFDLSMAQNFGFCQLLVAGLIVMSGVPWVVAVVVTLIVGGLIGLVNGVLIVRLQINSFIATLGMATVLAGLTTWFSGGQMVIGDFPGDFLSIGQIQVGDSLSIAVVYAVALAVLVWLGLTYLVTGRHLYATGGGRSAAELAGVRTGRLVIGSFVLCGVVAAATGVVTAAQLGTGQPALGPSYLLPAYAGVFLGATTVNPGRFNVWGTVIAVYLLGAGVSGLQQLGMQSYVQDLFNGGALIVAVGASVYVTRRRAVRLEAEEGLTTTDAPRADGGQPLDNTDGLAAVDGGGGA
jgi:ribose transport system permease protein